MPLVTVCSNPRGEPIAIAISPTRTERDAPIRANGRSAAWIRITARSVSGSSPTSVASNWRPSGRLTSIDAAPPATWLLVSA